MNKERRPQMFSYPRALGEQPLAQSFSLVELMHGITDNDDEMMREGICYVTGIKIAQKGTGLFDQMANQASNEIRKLTLGLEKERQAIEEILGREKLHATTAFRAYRYPLGDGMPYQAVVTDLRELAIVYFDRKSITLLPYGDLKSGPHRNLFYDAVGSKLALARWQYSGTMSDALVEFWGRSYSFERARYAQTPEEKTFVTNQPPDRQYITVETRLPLEKIVQIASD